MPYCLNKTKNLLECQGLLQKLRDHPAHLKKGFMYMYCKCSFDGNKRKVKSFDMISRESKRIKSFIYGIFFLILR